MSKEKRISWRVRKAKRPGGLFLLSIAALALFLIAPLLGARSANAATDMSTLVNKLVQKGVISRNDANTILAKSKRPQDHDTLPAWVRNLTFGGDLRLRYENLEVENQPTGPIHRARLRYRLQVGDQLMKNVKLVFGIASGGEGVAISRSTNVNLGNGFSGKLPRIDLTYVLLTPSKSLAIGVGKFPNPIWTPTMLTWDGNIRPEGIYAMITPPAGRGFDYWLNADLFTLGGQSGHNSAGMPLMGVINPGADLKLGAKSKIRLAAAYYVFNDLKQNYSSFNQLPANVNGIFHNVTGLNTDDSLDANGNLLYNYNDFWFGTQADFGGLSSVLPYAGVYAEYISNPAPSSDNKGYIFGLKLGHAAINKAGKWQINYNYRRLERNAWLDIFPNADVYFGSTNVMGGRAQFTAGLAKNMQAVVSYYNFKPIEQIGTMTAADHTENTVQVDWLMEF